MALKSITQTQGWGELHWGPRVETGEVVDLLISMAVTFHIHPVFSGKARVLTLRQHGLAIRTCCTS